MALRVITKKMLGAPCTLAALAFAVLAMLTPALVGQSAGTGALTGTVTDPSGAIVSGATVTLANTQTGQERTTTTGTDGAYRFSLIPPGTYRVRF
jgi:protocatechuate 3,4-dioxygenase beta subunit